MPEEQNPEKSSLKSKVSLAWVVVVLVSMLLGAVVVYGVAKKKPEFLGLPKGAAQIQAEIDLLLAELGKLIALPTDEKPTVATITDVDKLKEQVFFRNAQNGDKVIIYTSARRAILYRPSDKKIIEVGAVNINQASPSASVQASASPSPLRQTVTATPAPASSPSVGQ